MSPGQLIEIEGNFLKSFGLLSLRERKWNIINDKKNDKKTKMKYFYRKEIPGFMS